MQSGGSQRREQRSLWAAIATATLMIAHQVAGKATRDALFLSQFEIATLPRALVIAALLSLLAVMAMSRLLERVPPTRLVSACFAVSGVLFVGEWLLFDVQPRAAAGVLYLHMAVFGAILISGFWSVVGERFDPHTAKRRVAQVTAATALGGVFGAVVAERVGSFLGLQASLLVLAGMHALCAGGVLRIGVVASASAPAVVTPGLRTLARLPYLRAMAALVMLTAIGAALLDFTLKAAAQAHYRDGNGLIGFFAAYYAMTGIVGFLVQSALGPRLLQRFGIGFALAVLPVFTLAAGAVTALLHQFASVVLLRGGQAVLANSLNRSATELLYTPLTRDQKRPTKTIVDVAAERAGDMLGAGLVLLVLWLLPAFSGPVLVLLAMLASLVALWLVRRLHYGYVDQLARGLRRGVVTVDTDRVIDATTQHILAETSVYAEREQLLGKIREMREARGPARSDDTMLGRPSPVVDDAGFDLRPTTPFLPAATRGAGHGERLARAVADLGGDDPAAIRRVLAGDFMDIRLVAHLIPLLGRDEVAADVRMELRWLVPRVIGQLADALLDPDQPLRVRQRLPSVLEVCYNPRSIDALMLGLQDEEFSVRYSAARALARMRARDNTLRLGSALVYAAVRREVELEPEQWQTRRLLGDTAFDGSAETTISRTLEHVFTLLALVHDRGALELCMQALTGGDAHLRGTALEYLENVLPDELVVRLWVHLEVGESGAPRPTRPRVEVMRELRDSAGIATSNSADVGPPRGSRH